MSETSSTRPNTKQGEPLTMRNYTVIKSSGEAKHPYREYWAFDRNTFDFEIATNFVCWKDECDDPINFRRWGRVVRPKEWSLNYKRPAEEAGLTNEVIDSGKRQCIVAPPPPCTECPLFAHRLQVLSSEREVIEYHLNEAHKNMKVLSENVKKGTNRVLIQSLIVNLQHMTDRLNAVRHLLPEPPREPTSTSTSTVADEIQNDFFDCSQSTNFD